MEAISPKLFSYVSKNCQKVISDLALVYAKNVNSDIYTSQQIYTLMQRRILDWSLRNLLKKYSHPVVPGLILIPDYIDSVQERTLLNYIDSQNWNTSLKRRTQHYGYVYDYKSKNPSQKTQDIPDCIRKIEPFSVDQVIVNEYYKGQGISPHIDRVDHFGDYVAGISLEADSLFEFALGKHIETVLLPRRSLFIMTYESRYEWTHSLPARKRNLLGDRRVSVTYRNLRNTYIVPELVPRKLT